MSGHGLLWLKKLNEVQFKQVSRLINQLNSHVTSLRITTPTAALAHALTCHLKFPVFHPAFYPDAGRTCNGLCLPGLQQKGRRELVLHKYIQFFLIHNNFQ